MAPDLTTTNVFLGIMAAVSVLQAATIIGMFVGGVLVIRRFAHAMTAIEQQHVAPAAARVNAILDDVKEVTSTVREDAGRVDRLIDWLLERFGTHRRRRVSEAPEARAM
jgi:ubiquinone biosynthesis protein UbiJ